jgi:hypothetical protein
MGVRVCSGVNQPLPIAMVDHVSSHCDALCSVVLLLSGTNCTVNACCSCVAAAAAASAAASSAAEAIHGGLLSLGELLGHTGEFLLARYREVVETVLRFKDSKEKMIRR